MKDTVINFGGAVKTLGDGRVGGHLVLNGDPATKDFSGDFFTSDTDYGLHTKTDVLYLHGLDATLGKRSIGLGEIKTDELGVWIEAQLNLRDEYEKSIYALATKGKLGWSSGSASHLVERKSVGGGAWEITKWPLGIDASLTPTPCDSRNCVVALKSWNPQSGAIKTLYDPLDDIDDSITYSALMRLEDALWEAIHQVVWNEDDSLEDRIAFFESTCDGIKAKGAAILRQYGTIEATEADEIKSAVQRHKRREAADIKTLAEFEYFLRDSGHSRKNAQTIIANVKALLRDSAGGETVRPATTDEAAALLSLLKAG